jgi:carotenoid 1,2-hydratase
MTERPRLDVRRSADAFDVGPSRAVWRDQALVIDIDERAAPAPLATRGRIVVRPKMLTHRVFDLDAGGVHQWRPIAPDCDVRVRFDAPSLSWSGRGYLDSNAGAQPLEAGFTRWSWLRAHRGDACLISYDAIPRAGPRATLTLRIDADGQVSAAPPAPVQPLARSLWGLRQWVRADSATLRRQFEDTPFYTRGELDAVLGGRQGPAVYECLDLDRFSRAWVRALLPVRMPRRRAGPA